MLTRKMRITILAVVIVSVVGSIYWIQTGSGQSAEPNPLTRLESDNVLMETVENLG